MRPLMRPGSEMMPHQPPRTAAPLVDEEGYKEEEDLALLKKREVVEDPETLVEEGYGIGDDEPSGTNSYDVQDEWN